MLHRSMDLALPQVLWCGLNAQRASWPWAAEANLWTVEVSLPLSKGSAFVITQALAGGWAELDCPSH